VFRLGLLLVSFDPYAHGATALGTTRTRARGYEGGSDGGGRGAVR
jgi:hypothetical protein